MRIAIEGNIGAGKSTLIKKACWTPDATKEKKSFIHPAKDFASYISLKTLYENQKKYTFPFQLQVMLVMCLQPERELLDRCLVSAYEVFAKAAYKKGWMNKEQLGLIEEYFKYLWENEDKVKPDIIIYIRVPPVVSYKRMVERGRSEEKSLDFNYVRTLHMEYERMFEDRRWLMGCPVFELNGLLTREQLHFQLTMIRDEFRNRVKVERDFHVRCAYVREQLRGQTRRFMSDNTLMKKPTMRNLISVKTHTCKINYPPRVENTDKPTREQNQEPCTCRCHGR